MTITAIQQSATALTEALRARVARGDRFAGVFAARRDGGITLSAHVTVRGKGMRVGGSTRWKRCCRRVRSATRRSPRR